MQPQYNSSLPLPQELQSLPEDLKVVPTAKLHIYRVFVLLPSGVWRRVGRLHLRGEGTFYCRRDVERHLHRAADAWGISSLVLQLPIRWVELEADGVRYVTTKSYLIRHGAPRQWDGYEPQLLLTRSLWGEGRALEDEHSEEVWPKERKPGNCQLPLFAA